MQTTEAKTPADVRRLAGTHVSKTGHSVFVESGKQVRYTAKEKKE